MKTITNLFLCLMMLLFTGCQRKELVSNKKITINLQEGDPPSLNPYIGVDLRSRCLFLALFEPLMRKNATGELTLAAADAVDVDSTQTLYTFHIRSHRWSNGEPVTAYHFEKAWKYALKPGSHCFRADLFYLIKNAEAVKRGELPLDAVGIWAPNEKTLVVQLEHPTPYFLDLTATSFFAPLYHPSDEEPTDFNGPFVVKERVHDQKLVFKQNPRYWDVKTIGLEEINFTMIKDPITALTLYEKGELDLVGDPFSSLPFDVIPALEASGQLKSKLISRIFYLLLNTDVIPFNVKSFRQALGLSIDRRQLTEHLFFGELPSLSPLPKPLSSIEEKEFEQCQKNAVLLFEEALKELNLTRENFPIITLSYADLSGQKKLAEFIQEQWKKKLGIETKIECSDWNIHMSKVRKGNYQIGTLHLTTLYQDPMFYFDLFRDKKSLCNYTRWENANFRNLLEKSEKTIDKNDRHLYLQEAEWQLFDEMPAIPLFTQNLQYLVQDRVNLEITDVGIYDFKYSKIN